MGGYRIEQIRQETGDEQQEALVELTKEGETLDLKLISRNEEHCFVPVHVKDDQVQEMTQNEINALTTKQRAEIASNMRYMDKKYKLGKTKNICGKTKKQKGGKKKSKRKTKKRFLYNPNNPKKYKVPNITG